MNMRADQIMLKFPSSSRSIETIESFVNGIVEKYRINPELHCNILVSLTEAVNNAIIHGNSNDESKCVYVQLRKQRNSIAISVSDEGCGFDYQNLPDPTSPENLRRCGGRGVFLMQQLSDNIRFHNNGNTVEMKFKIG